MSCKGELESYRCKGGGREEDGVGVGLTEFDPGFIKPGLGLFVVWARTKKWGLLGLCFFFCSVLLYKGPVCSL